jgi:hypothetical protein
MKRIGITKHPNFPIDDWSRITVNLEDLFETPIDYTPEEVAFAKEFMELVQIDTDDDEGLLELIMKRSNLMSLSIHLRRMILAQVNKLQYQNTKWQNLEKQ